jgi:hypothetical protein
LTLLDRALQKAVDPANGKLLCMGRCSGNRQLFDCFTVAVIIRSHDMSYECRLTCKPAFDERDWGAFLIVGALPPFPPLPPLPPFPDCKQQSTYTTQHKVRLSGWAQVFNYWFPCTTVMDHSTSEATADDLHGDLVGKASLPYVGVMPCRWGSRATRAKLTMISNIGNCRRANAANRSPAVRLKMTRKGSPGARCVRFWAFPKHAPEFWNNPHTFTSHSFPTTLVN